MRYAVAKKKKDQVKKPDLDTAKLKERLRQLERDSSGDKKKAAAEGKQDAPVSPDAVKKQKAEGASL